MGGGEEGGEDCPRGSSHQAICVLLPLQLAETPTQHQGATPSLPSDWSAQNCGNIASTFKDICPLSLSWTQDPFCLITMSLGSHTFCLIRPPKSSWILSESLWFVFLMLRVCFSHPQGGRDEGNYLDDALVRQDAQVSRTAASFFSFANKTDPSWWTLVVS